MKSEQRIEELNGLGGRVMLSNTRATDRQLLLDLISKELKRLEGFQRGWDRVCIDCGITFKARGRAKRCPEHAELHKKELERVEQEAQKESVAIKNRGLK